MADDLSIQTANSMMQMIASRGSTEMSTKLMKMQAQQDESVAALLADQAAAFKNAGYNSNGASVASIGQGSIDTSV
jgi:proline racemase